MRYLVKEYNIDKGEFVGTEFSNIWDVNIKVFQNYDEGFDYYAKELKEIEGNFIADNPDLLTIKDGSDIRSDKVNVTGVFVMNRTKEEEDYFWYYDFIAREFIEDERCR